MPETNTPCRIAHATKRHRQIHGRVDRQSFPPGFRALRAVISRLPRFLFYRSAGGMGFTPRENDESHFLQKE
jgi:hypothetical protein